MEATIAQERQNKYISTKDPDSGTQKSDFNNRLTNQDFIEKSSTNGAFLLQEDKDTQQVALHQQRQNEENDNYKEVDEWSAIKKIINDPWCHSILPDVSNMCSVLGNACSALAHIVKVPDNVRAVADVLASFGTKFFLYVNATIKTLEELSRHNYLVALGYFMDNIIATFIPQEHTFLARGVSSGTYHGGLSLNLLNDKIKFKNFSEHFQHLKDSIKLVVNKLWNEKSFGHILSSDNAIPGVLGGVLSALGVVVWPLFGKKAATIVRDIGGIIKAANYANPDNLHNGRKLYFSSGMMQMGAAVADFLGGHFNQTRSFMVPISLGLDGFSKYILRQSINKGELGEI